MTKQEKQQLLEQKLLQMQVFEKELYSKGVKTIAGVDEVGRGPLAGPVVAAAVVLPQDFKILGVDDSKKLTEKKRESLYEEIKEASLGYAFGVVDNETIDEINILEATKLAMKKAVGELQEMLDGGPDHLLIDALRLPDVDIPQTDIVKGDEKSVSIAAASILAKVMRDRMMVEYHSKYPAYGFDRNKGYGTKLHYAGLDADGISSIHRKSFLIKYLQSKG